jgi:chitinase
MFSLKNSVLELIIVKFVSLQRACFYTLVPFLWFNDDTETLRDNFLLPPKRILTTTFLPSAWVDDTLIAERKAGLARYLTHVLSSSEYKDHPYLLQFLTSTDSKSAMPSQKFNAEDAVPSTLPREAALGLDVNVQDEVAGGFQTNAAAIAAAYYPDWRAGSFPPESLDYALFDIIFFGT